MSFEHVFDEMEIDADPFALCELLGRCDLGLGRQAFATLHYVLAGEGEILLGDRRTIGVAPGTLVLIPAVQPHTLRSHGERGNPLPACRPAEVGLARHLHKIGEGDEAARLLAICSQVKIGVRGLHGLVDLIREPIVERIGQDSPLAATVDQLLAELSNPVLGSRAMIRVLLQQCMIHLLRRRLDAREQALHWMAVLADESLWSALRAMLDQPGGQHSVESLADAAGMSRSTFAERFSAAYGSGPMELLRSLRMHLAASLLAQSETPVKRIAELVGFKSRSAFTKTFESHTGKPPQRFRADTRGGKDH
ncbi:MAG: AraC family transcriptional regulator [Geminicoccaceae bacterium]